MQRTEQKLEEWTKYFVNDVECKRDDIYQSILDHQFYSGDVNLNKKYHYYLEESNITETRYSKGNSCGYSRTVDTNYNTKNQSAQFTLNTKKFAEKTSPESKEFKLLVDKMIQVVDIFYLAQNSETYSNELRAAVIDCMSFNIDKTAKSKDAFQEIFGKFTVECFAFMFDMIALYSCLTSKKEVEEKNLTQIEQPSLKFDNSSIKEAWNESWDNGKKLKYIKNYLEVMLKQTDALCKIWLKHPVIAKTFEDSIQNKFNDFKNVIKSLQIKRKDHKKALGIKTGISSIFSMFNKAEAKTSNASSAVEVKRARY